MSRFRSVWRCQRVTGDCKGPFAGIVRLITEYTARGNFELLEIALSPDMGHIDTIGCFDSLRGPRGPRKALYRMQWVRQGHSLGNWRRDRTPRPMQQELDARRAPSGMCLSDSAAPSSPACVSCSLCSSTCMRKTPGYLEVFAEPVGTTKNTTEGAPPWSAPCAHPSLLSTRVPGSAGLRT